jgi:hypothetical protein
MRTPDSVYFSEWEDQTFGYVLTPFYPVLRLILVFFSLSLPFRTWAITKNCNAITRLLAPASKPCLTSSKPTDSVNVCSKCALQTLYTNPNSGSFSERKDLFFGYVLSYRYIPPPTTPMTWRRQKHVGKVKIDPPLFLTPQELRRIVSGVAYRRAVDHPLQKKLIWPFEVLPVIPVVTSTPLHEKEFNSASVSAKKWPYPASGSKVSSHSNFLTPQELHRIVSGVACTHYKKN